MSFQVLQAEYSIIRFRETSSRGNENQQSASYKDIFTRSDQEQSQITSSEENKRSDPVPVFQEEPTELVPTQVKEQIPIKKQTIIGVSARRSRFHKT